MESYEVLQKAIPELQSPKVAKFLGISANYVNRWRRRPSDDEEPTATGQRSILDRITDLIDVVFLINPSGSGLTDAVEAVNSLNVDGCTPETLAELVQLRDSADYAIKQVEKTLAQEASAK